jgi:hypothetical protein
MFLFTSGDFTLWLYALKSEVSPGTAYSSIGKTAIKSSASAIPYQILWDNSSIVSGPHVFTN